MNIRLLCNALCFIAVAVQAVEEGFVEIPGVKTTYKVLKEGTTKKTIRKGDTVTVHATGTVRQTRKKFWSTKDPGQQPFTYTAGGGVITGWDKGAQGMRKNEVRMLKIPADEGYGKGGFPAWGIPPGGELNFEIQVLRIADGKDKKNIHDL